MFHSNWQWQCVWLGFACWWMISEYNHVFMPVCVFFQQNKFPVWKYSHGHVCVLLWTKHFLSEITVMCSCQSLCWFEQKNNIFKQWTSGCTFLLKCAFYLCCNLNASILRLSESKDMYIIMSVKTCTVQINIKDGVFICLVCCVWEDEEVYIYIVTELYIVVHCVHY